VDKLVDKSRRMKRQKHTQTCDLAPVLPAVLLFLSPLNRLVLRSCHRAFLDKRVRQQILILDQLLLARFTGLRTSLDDLDVGHVMSAVPSEVRSLEVNEPWRCYWPKFVCADLSGLETLTMRLGKGVAFEKVRHMCSRLDRAPSSLELRVHIHEMDTHDVRERERPLCASPADFGTITELELGCSQGPGFSRLLEALPNLRSLTVLTMATIWIPLGALQQR
jgi:hypothetical protein